MTPWIVGLVFVLLSVVPLALVVCLLVYAARAATITVGQCRRCGYDLRELGERRACPECGHPFVVAANGDVLSMRRNDTVASSPPAQPPSASSSSTSSPRSSVASSQA